MISEFIWREHVGCLDSAVGLSCVIVVKLLPEVLVLCLQFLVSWRPIIPAVDGPNV